MTKADLPTSIEALLEAQVVGRTELSLYHCLGRHPRSEARKYE